MIPHRRFRSGRMATLLVFLFCFLQQSFSQTVTLNSLAIKSNAPVSGNKTKGTVTAAVPAPTGGVTVWLSSSNTSVAAVPSSVLIPAGSKTVTFTITTGAVSTATTVNITASSANSKSAALTVNPAMTVNWTGGPGPSFPITNQCFVGDFNGDGKADLACYTGTAGIWNVVLSTGSGWKSQFWSGGPGVAIPVTQQCFAADFNGDHKTDLACYTGNPGSWNVALSTGKGWKSEFWNNGPTPPQEWFVTPVGGQCFVGNFNGDSKADVTCPASLATCGGSICTTPLWNTGLSTGSGWNLKSWNEVGGPWGAAIPVTDQCFTGDFNGDKKTDLACWSGLGSSWGVSLSTGTSWNESDWLGGPTPPQEWFVTPVGGQCFAGDFNGDGITDLACYSGSSGVWAVALSSGKGW